MWQWGSLGRRYGQRVVAVLEVSCPLGEGLLGHPRARLRSTGGPEIRLVPFMPVGLLPTRAGWAACLN